MGHAAKLAQSWANALEESLSIGLARIRAEVVAVAEHDVPVVRAAFQIVVEWKLRGTLKAALLQALQADMTASGSGAIDTEQIGQLKSQIGELRETLRSREHQDRADHASQGLLTELERQRALLSTQAAELAASLAQGPALETVASAVKPAPVEVNQDQKRERGDVHTERRLDQSTTRTARAAD